MVYFMGFRELHGNENLPCDTRLGGQLCYPAKHSLGRHLSGE